MLTEDERAQSMERLFLDYYTRLYLYALNFLEDEDEAKDVVSNVFASIWQKWQRTGSVEAPDATLLYTLVRNSCIDTLRHTKAKENYALFVERYYKTHHEDAPDEYERRMTHVGKLIDLLPEPDKSILHCCYFRNMTYRKTADALELTLVVVKKRMLKVFKFLREELRKDKKEA